MAPMASMAYWPAARLSARQVPSPLEAAFVWTRAVGTGALPLAAVSMVTGPNMWNLGRIVAAGCALVGLPSWIVVYRRLRMVGRGLYPHRQSAAPALRRPVLVVLVAQLSVAGVWFTTGLLGWLGVADPVPVQDVLRWPVLPLAVLTLLGTAWSSGELRGSWPARWPGIVLDLCAQAVMGAGGILIVAAPFELVGVAVRGYLVTAFALACAVRLVLVVVGGVGGGVRMLGAAGCVLAASVALVVPGWTGPILGGLLGQPALCLSGRLSVSHRGGAGAGG